MNNDVKDSFGRLIGYLQLFPYAEGVWEEKPWKHDSFLSVPFLSLLKTFEIALFIL